MVECAMRSTLAVVDPPHFKSLLASSMDANSWPFKHSSRSLPLIESHKPLSVGLPGIVKSKCTSFPQGYWSGALELNSLPWSTVIERGQARIVPTRPKACATPSPVSRNPISCNTLSRIQLSTPGAICAVLAVEQCRSNAHRKAKSPTFLAGLSA
jgi:hypothetical protein